jgi:hypothetical protein
MFNLSSLFEDYEKRYNTWLKNSAVPNVKGWYDKSGLDTGFQNIQQGLLGTESRQMHPTEGVVTGDRYGGIFGQGGSAGKALDYAGGKVLGARIGYGEGKVDPRLAAAAGRTKTSGFPTKISGEGAIKGRMPGAIEKGLGTGVDTVKKGVDLGNQAFKGKTPDAPTNIVYKDDIMRGGAGTKQGEDPSWWQGLANKFNSKFNMDDAVASWKEKGGFEGLMANPAFTMGLAFMQAGAEGKTLGSGALNNVMKAAGISSHYKQILKDREQAPIEVTAQDVGEVKSLLQSMDISGPSNVEKFFGFLKGEKIAVELQKEIKKLKENKKPGAPEVVYDTTKKLQILKRMFDEGRFKKKGGTWFTDSTLQTTQEIPTLDSNKPKINKKNPLKGYVGFAQGGQIQEGQHAIVGEGGPEYFLPKESGKILSNDDSRIFAMLLAANPQLQQVSRTRSEKILRNRFPEYFE